MNANELAYKLALRLSYLSGLYNDEELMDASKLIIQQQTEIEALKAGDGDYMEGWEEGFAACKKEINAEVEANAHLIAAAPELLDAAILGLSISESWIKEQYSGERYKQANEALNPIRSAIAKARGEA